MEHLYSHLNGHRMRLNVTNSDKYVIIKLLEVVKRQDIHTINFSVLVGYTRHENKWGR